MKKLIAIIAILAFATTVFATESDPSETVGFVKWDLIHNGTSGYNIIAVPLGTDMVTTCDILFANIPNCNTLSKYDAANQGWVAYDGMPWTPTWNIESGHSYMAHATLSGTWYSLGDLQTPPVFSLINDGTSGYNMIMLPLDKVALNMCDLLFADIPNCNTLSKYDAANQGWIAYDGMPWTPTWSTDIGRGYMVHVTTSGTWPTSKASAPGKIQLIKIRKLNNK